MRFEVGDRVHLLETTSWIICDNNPAIGTEWYCEGIVTSYSDSGNFNVDWDNGRSNSYNLIDEDIELVSQEILI